MRHTPVVVLLLALASSANAATFKVTSPADSGPGTLRDAILQSNATPGRDSIQINVMAAPSSPLPPITDPADIIGFSNSGIDGTNAGAATDGLVVTGAASHVYGLQIQNFGGDGLVVNASNTDLRNLYVTKNQNGIRITGKRANLYTSSFIANRANGIWATASSSGLRMGGTEVGIGPTEPLIVTSYDNGLTGLRIDGSDSDIDQTCIGRSGGDGVVVTGAHNRTHFLISTDNRGNGFVYMPGNQPWLNLNYGGCNGLLLFDVNGDGPTPNDDPDIDGVTNAPVLTSVIDAGDVVTVGGVLTATPSTEFDVTLFSATTCVWSYGADLTVTTDASGHASFRKALPRNKSGQYAAQVSRVTVEADRNFHVDPSELSNSLGITAVESSNNADLSVQIVKTVQSDKTLDVEGRITNNGPSAAGPFTICATSRSAHDPVCSYANPPLANGESMPFTLRLPFEIHDDAITTKVQVIPSAQHPDPQPANNLAVRTESVARRRLASRR